MKIEATAKDIRALLDLAGADGEVDRPAAESRRPDRQAAARRVPRRLLERYELLREVGRTPVLVAIEGGGCSGCHVRLPTMVEYRARRSPAVHTCPHCRRMLYSPDLLREEPPGGDGRSRRDAPATAGRRP